MQITSYNPHLGLLRSEHCWGEHRTVYSGRREADVVMTSIRTWSLFGAFRCGRALTGGGERRRGRLPYSHRNTFAESAVNAANTTASASKSPRWAAHASPIHIPASNDTA